MYKIHVISLIRNGLNVLMMLMLLIWDVHLFQTVFFPLTYSLDDDTGTWVLRVVPPGVSSFQTDVYQIFISSSSINSSVLHSYIFDKLNAIPKGAVGLIHFFYTHITRNFGLSIYFGSQLCWTGLSISKCNHCWGLCYCTLLVIMS